MQSSTKLRSLSVFALTVLAVSVTASSARSDLNLSLPKKPVKVDPKAATEAASKTVDKVTKKADRLAATALKQVSQLTRRPLRFQVPSAHLAFALKKLGTSAGVQADFEVTGSHVGKDGKKHSYYQQNVGGLRVFGAEMAVHARADGTAEGVTDYLLPNPEVTGTVKLDEARAIAAAEAKSGCKKCLRAGSRPELLALPFGEEVRRVYRVELRNDSKAGLSAPVHMVDAETGKVLLSYDDVAADVSAKTFYSGSVKVPTYSGGGYVYLESTKQAFGTFDMDGQEYGNPYRVVDSGSGFAGPASDAHWGLAKTLEYFSKVHGRDGMDGAKGPVKYPAKDGTPVFAQLVNFGADYNNAYWDGVEKTITYGNGDGKEFGPLVSIDVVAHEFTHGLIDHTADLIYQGESGALNESFADVFAAMVERRVRGESDKTWLIGEDVITPGVAGDAIRSMANPKAFGGAPDHYSERYTGYGDRGGVHINSSIPNHAFYLLAKGGKHRLGTEVKGIGADKAAAIWYKALTEYMFQTSDFAWTRSATMQAASVLYGEGSDAQNAVCRAWFAVGVGSSCDPQWLMNGRFDYASPWSFSGKASLSTTGSYARSTNGYAYLTASAQAKGSIVQNLAIPSNASTANLTFYLNVTSNETTTTKVKDTLAVEVVDSAGTVLQTVATYSNLQKGAVGKYALQGPFDLALHKGKDVRLQFRMVGDAATSTMFRIDDVVLK